MRSRLESLPPAVRGIGAVVALLLVAGILALAVLVLTGALDDPEVETGEVQAAARSATPERDPYAWQPSRLEDFESGAALGFSHLLYELSPDGVLASAERTASYGEQIDEAAREHGADAATMEAMVFLESAGRPDVIAGGTDVEAASGLAQIVASTGTDFLGMRIYLDRSQELTNEIVSSLEAATSLRRKAEKLAGGSAKQRRKAAKLEQRAEREAEEAERARRARVQIDPRFDPAQALDGMGLYLEQAEESLGREDLAVASYHMGIGNLQTALGAYAGGRGGEPPADTSDFPYAQLYFDSSPIVHEDAYRVLTGFEDDSATYLWRVLAAKEIMRLYHEDRNELGRLIELHGNKATAEEVFHPEDETRTFGDAAELEDGIEGGELVEIPTGADADEFGYTVGRQLGELTDELGVDRSLYASLRPEALAALIYITGRVQAITGEDGPKDKLTVTSAVRDQAYQDELTGSNPEATTEYSLHTTGYSFDILRDYRNDRQAEAFQFVLDRMKALGVIDYAYEPSAIHVTVSDRAEPLLED